MNQSKLQNGTSTNQCGKEDKKFTALISSSPSYIINISDISIPWILRKQFKMIIFLFPLCTKPIKVTNMAQACMNVAKKIQKYMALISWSPSYVINVRDISIPLATSYLLYATHNSAEAPPNIPDLCGVSHLLQHLVDVLHRRRLAQFIKRVVAGLVTVSKLTPGCSWSQASLSLLLRLFRRVSKSKKAVSLLAFANLDHLGFPFRTSPSRCLRAWSPTTSFWLTTASVALSGLLLFFTIEVTTALTLFKVVQPDAAMSPLGHGETNTRRCYKDQHWERCGIQWTETFFFHFQSNYMQSHK